MTAAATPLEDAPPWARPLLERQIAMAGQLAEGALELAMAVKDEALTPDGGVEPAVLEGLTRAYARMARSTRLSLMLQDRLIKDLIAFDKGEAPDAGRDDRRDDVERIVRIIVDPQVPAEAGERLVKEAAERLDRETLESAILSRPVRELAAMICKDLGLDPDAWPLATLPPGQGPETSKHEEGHEERGAHAAARPRCGRAMQNNSS